LNEPIKVVMTRQQIFHLIGMRPTSMQRFVSGRGVTADWSRSPTR